MLSGDTRTAFHKYSSPMSSTFSVTNPLLHATNLLSLMFTIRKNRSKHLRGRRERERERGREGGREGGREERGREGGREGGRREGGGMGGFLQWLYAVTMYCRNWWSLGSLLSVSYLKPFSVSCCGDILWTFSVNIFLAVSGSMSGSSDTNCGEGGV